MLNHGILMFLIWLTGHLHFYLSLDWLKSGNAAIYLLIRIATFFSIQLEINLFKKLAMFASYSNIQVHVLILETFQP